VIHSAEELDRAQGGRVPPARHGGDGRARASGCEGIQLRAAAGAAILEGGGDIDFLIIGSTSMDNPALIFGNRAPPAACSEGDIINMELAAGYRGYLRRSASHLPRRADADGAKILG
jgi:hypothetical protein